MTHKLRKVPSSLALLVGLVSLGCGEATESGVQDAAAGAGDAGAAASPISSAPVSNAPARVDLRPSAEGGGRALPVLPSVDAGGSGPADGAAGSSRNAAGREPVAPGSDTTSPGDPVSDTTAPLSTLREVRQTLTAVQALTGVVSRPSDGRRYGFVTFDVGQLPANIRKLERAVVHTGPYVVGEPIPVYHVAFDELTPAAVTGDELQLLTSLPRGTSGALLVPTAIADVLAPDYLARSESHHYSQFRIDLPTSTSDADANLVAGLLSAAAVDLDYLVP